MRNEEWEGNICGCDWIKIMLEWVDWKNVQQTEKSFAINTSTYGKYHAFHLLTNRMNVKSFVQFFFLLLLVRNICNLSVKFSLYLHIVHSLQCWFISMILNFMSVCVHVRGYKSLYEIFIYHALNPINFWFFACNLQSYQQLPSLFLTFAFFYPIITQS